MSLKNKIDFAVIFKVKNANPNGDPLNGNRPRTNLEGYGELSDVCIKRKIRDRLQEQGISIFVQSNDRKNDNCNSLKERFDKAQISSNANEAIDQACSLWFDVRAFGQVFAYKDPNKGKSKKQKDDVENSQQDEAALSIGIRGPVSIHPAFSIKPIEITTLQITKSVNSEGDGKKKGSDTMGAKHRVDYGTYVFFGSINPQLAEKTKFSTEDAELIKNILPKLFENDASSARPEGSMSVKKVIWWEHPSKSGEYSSSIVHSSLKVLDENTIELAELEKLKPEVINGY